MFVTALVTLYTHDIEAGLHFYGGLLGFRETFRTPADGVPEHVELRLGDLTIGLGAVEAARRVHDVEASPGSPAMALVVWTDDVDAAYDGLAAAGVPTVRAPYDAGDDKRTALVRDPDGTLVELVSRRRAEDADPAVSMGTGIRGQRLVVSGWFASHADTGTPGPHVHLSTSDRANPVLRTSQVPELVDGLRTVADRIDRMWEKDGADWFTGDEPDDNDPALRRRRRLDHLVFLDRLQARLPDVTAILLEAEDLHDASAAIARLLDLDEVEVETRLGGISLFSLTRSASVARTRMVEELRRQP